jgi:hypothetical protein
MSSQFSYDLDERQIRILMQDAELDYNEALWHKFDELAISQSKSSHNISNYIPKINFSISRSIVVPILFIVLIGGLSAMLFSFVDFKKKQSIDKEIPLVANSEKIKEPVIIPKEVIKPKSKVSVIVKTNSVISANSGSAITTPEIKKEMPAKVAEEKPKEIVTPDIIHKKENVTPAPTKKKKRKIKTEVLPTINTSTNLNEGVSEPELDLNLK